MKNVKPLNKDALFNQKKRATFMIVIGAIVLALAVMVNLDGATLTSVLSTIAAVASVSFGALLLRQSLELEGEDYRAAMLLGKRNQTVQRYLNALKEMPRGIRSLTYGEYETLRWVMRKDEVMEAKDRWIN